MNKDLINQRFINAVDRLISDNKNLKKGQIAEKIGLKPAKFSEILNKRMNVGLDALASICIEYNVNSEYILTGNGDLYKQNNVKEEKSPFYENSSNIENDFDSKFVQMILDSPQFKNEITDHLNKVSKDLKQFKKDMLDLIMVQGEAKLRKENEEKRKRLSS